MNVSVGDSDFVGQHFINNLNYIGKNPDDNVLLIHGAIEALAEVIDARFERLELLLKKIHGAPEDWKPNNLPEITLT